MGILFWLLRGRTHFGGDGYLLLSGLGFNWTEYEQARAIGESLIHIWVKSLLGGGGKDVALLSYQITSIGSGLLFLAILFFGVRILLKRNSDRLILFLGVSTGGYVLLFYGYVENYSVLVVSVLTFAIAGLLISKRQMNRWFALPLLALSITLHIFGVVLIPAAVYLMISGTRVEKTIKRLGLGTRVSLLSLAALTAVAVFAYFYITNYYFRFNIVPLYEDRFVANGYTMLSVNHLLDYSNLIFLLTPSILLLAVLLFSAPLRLFQTRPDYQYLTILVLSVLGATFVFDPDLGMPRDWDMLSFSGVPLVLAVFYLVLQNAARIRYSRTICLLAIMLNILVLGPRIAGQVDPDVSLAHYMHYLTLDRERGLTAGVVLRNYHLERGDTTAANETRRWYLERFPEDRLLRQAIKVRKEGRLPGALSLARQALLLNPSDVTAYCSMGASFLALRMIDSAQAYFEIANGMRPGNSVILYSLGNTYYAERNLQKAEEFWKESLRIDTTSAEPLIGLSRLARMNGNPMFYKQCLDKAVTFKDAPGFVVKELADFYYSQGSTAHALRLYSLAVKRGLPQTTVDELLKAFPQLATDGH